MVVNEHNGRKRPRITKQDNTNPLFIDFGMDHTPPSPNHRFVHDFLLFRSTPTGILLAAAAVSKKKHLRHPVVIFSDNLWGGSNHRNKTKGQLSEGEPGPLEYTETSIYIMPHPTRKRQTHGFQPWFRPHSSSKQCALNSYRGTCAAATRSIS